MMSLHSAFIKPRPLKFLTSMGCVSPSRLSIILGICVGLLDHSLESVSALRWPSSPGGPCRSWSKFSYLVVWLHEKGDAFSCDQNLKFFCTTTLTLLLFSILSTFYRKHFIWICVYFQIVETVPHVWAWYWSDRALLKHLFGKDAVRG